VAFVQPPEEPIEPAGPPALPAARKLKKKNIINVADLTETGMVRRKKEMKSLSNKRQAEKRREEKERERERLKSLSPGEKEKLARGVMERDKEWAVIDAYDKDNDETWGSWKKKRDWAEGNLEEDFWELNKLPEILEKMDRDKE
jgi:hypothetical protein